MGTRFRAAVLGMVLAACGGEKFGTGSPAQGASGSGSSGGGTSGGSEPVVGGGQGGRGEAGAPDVPADAGRTGDGGEESGGEMGSGGAAEPVCAVSCRADEECTATASGAECRCGGGRVGDGDGCRLPRSCNELHRYAPMLPSGVYELKPKIDDASFKAHCGMMQEGGGWTLVLSEGPTFDPTTNGAADVLGYASSGTNIGYSLVLIEADVMLDVSNSPIETTTYAARLIVTGLPDKSRGKALRTLFTTGPHYVEAENNENLAVRMRDGAECESLPVDLAKLACQRCETPGCTVPVIVFGDGDGDPLCRMGDAPRLAIGAATDYSTPWTNCAGWPQDPNYTGIDFYPDYVRVWVR